MLKTSMEISSQRKAAQFMTMLSGLLKTGGDSPLTQAKCHQQKSGGARLNLMRQLVRFLYEVCMIDGYYVNKLGSVIGGGKQKRIRKAANSRQQNTHTTIPSTPQNSSPASQKTKTPGTLSSREGKISIQWNPLIQYVGRKGTKNGPSPPEKSDAALELEQLKQYAKAAKELLDAGNYSSASMVSQRTVRRLTKAVIKGRLSSALPPIEGRVDINLPLLRLKRSKSFWDRVTDNTFREQAARWGDARQPYYKMRRDKLRKRYKKVMRTIPEELKDGTKQKHDRKRKRLPNLWSDLIHLFYGHRGPQDNSDIEHVRREYRIGLGLRALVYRFGVGVLCLQPASKETK